MRILFDSSTLIAAIIQSHENHNQAFSWLVRAKNNEFDLVVAAHSLLEVYSVLTIAPFQPRILPLTARKLIEVNIINHAEIQSLDYSDYINVIESVSALGLKGGIIYDAIIYACAQISKSEKIVTLNTKDFNRLNSDNAFEIVAP